MRMCETNVRTCRVDLHTRFPSDPDTYTRTFLPASAVAISSNRLSPTPPTNPPTPRHAAYMEEENEKMRQIVADMKSKYYEEKKSWQSKLRSAHAETQAAVSSAASANSSVANMENLPPALPASASARASASASGNSTEVDSIWTAKLSTLQAVAEGKSEEAKALHIQNAELKLQLQQYVFQASGIPKLRHSISSGNDPVPGTGGEVGTADTDALNAAQSEARGLRQRCGELEITIRRNAREQERLTKTVQNQTLLEEEVISLKTQLKFEKEKNESLVSLEGELLVMQQQVDSWETTFRELVEDAVNTYSASSVPAGMGVVNGNGSGNGSSANTNIKNSVVKTLNFDDMDSFDSTSHKSSVSVTPAMVLHIISQQQNKCAILTKECSVANAKLHETQRDMRHVQERVIALTRENSNTISKFDALTLEHNNSKRIASLYDKEISSLRGLVRSYEKEMTLGKPDAILTLGIQEKVITELRQEFDVQRSKLADMMSLQPVPSGVNSATTAPACAPVSTSTSKHGLVHGPDALTLTTEEQVASLAAALEQHKAQITALKNQLYHISVAGGMDFAPGMTRILHFSNNPFALSRAAIGAAPANSSAIASSTSTSSLPPVALKAAKAEIRRLKECISAATSSHNSYADSGGSGGGGADESMLNQSILDTTSTTPHTGGGGGGSQPVGSSKVSRGLASVGADSVKLNLRLKEMFRERITLFREAVYLLSGFKVDLIFENEAGQGKTHPKLRLRSMYADNPDDSLLFSWDGKHQLDLIETPYISKLDPRLLEQLHICKSVPAFLAGITMDLFENQTFMG